MKNLQTYRLPMALFFALLYMSLATQSGLLTLSKVDDFVSSPEQGPRVVQTELIICSGASNTVISSPVKREPKLVSKARFVVNGLHIAKSSCSKCSKPRNKCCCNKKDLTQVLMDQACSVEDFHLNVAEKLLPSVAVDELPQVFSEQAKKSFPMIDFSYHFSLHLSIDKVPIV